MKKKILVVGFWQDGIENFEDVVCYPDYYRQVKGIDKLLFKIRRHLQFAGGVTSYLGEWADGDLSSYKYIFLGDGFEDRSTVEYIRQRNPKAKIIVYYVNHFNDSTGNHPRKIRDLVSDIYSFDYGNSKCEHLRFQPFFYPYETMVPKNVHSSVKTSDVFFCGGDKGRYKKIKLTFDALKKMGLRCNFIVVKTERGTVEEEGFPLRKSPISYAELLQGVLESRAILEINVEGQDGITLRAMESMFCERKLITNNVAVKHYDFYDEQNIFLLGERPMEELPKFLQTDFKPVDDNIKKRYTFKSWFRSFFEES